MDGCVSAGSRRRRRPVVDVGQQPLGLPVFGHGPAELSRRFARPTLATEPNWLALGGRNRLTPLQRRDRLAQQHWALGLHWNGSRIDVCRGLEEKTCR